MSRPKAAVVGVGYLGRFHAQKYKQLDSVELVGVYDASPDRAAEVASELGVQAFSSLEAVAEEVQMVTVASTTTTHFEVTQFFLEKGIHVNVEKPITEKLDQGLALMRLAQSKRLVLSVGHIERFNPVFKYIQKEITKPLVIECKRHGLFKARGSDVSVAHDLMIHDIDLALTLARSPIKSVSAKGTTLAGSSWDSIDATIVFESGTLAHLSASRVSPTMKREIRVVEEGRIISGDFSTGELVVSSAETQGDEPLSHVTHSFDKIDALYVETEDFVRAVTTSSAPRVTADDGVTALEVVEKVINAL